MYKSVIMIDADVSMLQSERHQAEVSALRETVDEFEVRVKHLTIENTHLQHTVDYLEKQHAEVRTRALLCFVQQELCFLRKRFCKRRCVRSVCCFFALRFFLVCSCLCEFLLILFLNVFVSCFSFLFP